MPTNDRCELCKKNPWEMIYAVDPEREKPLCGACFGKWEPSVLNGLLGLKTPASESSPPPAVERRLP